MEHNQRAAMHVTAMQIGMPYIPIKSWQCSRGTPSVNWMLLSQPLTAMEVLTHHLHLIQQQNCNQKEEKIQPVTYIAES